MIILSILDIPWDGIGWQSSTGSTLFTASAQNGPKEVIIECFFNIHLFNVHLGGDKLDLPT